LDKQENFEIFVAHQLRSISDPRFRRLVAEVLTRIPRDWDFEPAFLPQVEWTIELSDLEKIVESPSLPGQIVSAYATAISPPDLSYPNVQVWEVTLHRSALDELSDSAARWVIAHEFAHMALRRPSAEKVAGMRVVRSDKDVSEVTSSYFRHGENDADRLAIDWGFQEEKRAFDIETEIKGISRINGKTHRT